VADEHKYPYSIAITVDKGSATYGVRLDIIELPNQEKAEEIADKLYDLMVQHLDVLNAKN